MVVDLDLAHLFLTDQEPVDFLKGQDLEVVAEEGQVDLDLVAEEAVDLGEDLVVLEVQVGLVEVAETEVVEVGVVALNAKC